MSFFWHCIVEPQNVKCYNNHNYRFNMGQYALFPQKARKERCRMLNRLIEKLNNKIQDFNGKKQKKLVELLKRIENINIDEFMVSTV